MGFLCRTFSQHLFDHLPFESVYLLDYTNHQGFNKPSLCYRELAVGVQNVTNVICGLDKLGRGNIGRYALSGYEGCIDEQVVAWRNRLSINEQKVDR